MGLMKITPEIVEATLRLLKLYKNPLCSPEAFLEDQLMKKKKSVEFKSTTAELFYGCVHYASLLDCTVECFYQEEGKLQKRANMDLFKVLAYILVWKMQEVSRTSLQTTFLSRHFSPELLVSLLEFFVSKKSAGVLAKAWELVYDNEFVKLRLETPLELNRTWFTKLLFDVQATTSVKKRESVPPTLPNPFSFNHLMKAPPPPPTSPERPLVIQASDVPISTYKLPRNFKILEKKKKKNWAESQKLLLNSRIDQFQCASTDKSERFKETVSMLEEERKPQKLPKPKPAPKFSKLKQEFKYTTAALLREGAQFIKKQEKEFQRIEDLVKGGHDLSENEIREEKMQMEKQREMAEELERKHVEALLSFERALLAQTDVQIKRRDKANLIRLDSDKVAKQLQQIQEQRQRKLRFIWEKVKTSEDNAREQQLKIQQSRRIEAIKINMETEQLKQEVEEMEREEMEKKKDIIMQIRALESVPKGPLMKTVDFSEPPGHGLLNEMSLVELKERLTLLKYHFEEDQKLKQEKVIALKEEKQKLIEKMTTIVMASRQQRSLSEKKTINARQPPKAESKVIEELRQKLEAKRSERKRLQEILGLDFRQRAKSTVSQKSSLSMSKDEMIYPETFSINESLYELESLDEACGNIMK